MDKPFLLIGVRDDMSPTATGGWIDRFATREEAEACVQKNPKGPIYKYLIKGQDFDWYEIVDLRTWQPEVT